MTEDITKGKKRTRKRLTALERLHQDCAHPDGHEAAADANALADGYTSAMHDDVARADEFKNMSHAVPTVTSDIGQRYQADHSYPAPRDPAGNPRAGNAPRPAGKRTHPVGAEAAIPVSSSDGDYNHHAQLAARAGDVGSMHVPVEGEDPSTVKQLGEPSANPLAYALRYAQRQAVSGSLRQSSTVTEALATLRTARGNVQDIGFGPDSDVPGGYSHAGVAVLRTLDAASDAGEYRDAHGRDVLNQVNYSPYRPDSHQHRDSATPPNGSHSSGSQQGAACPPRDSMKASKLEIMRSTQKIIT